MAMDVGNLPPARLSCPESFRCPSSGITAHGLRLHAWFHPDSWRSSRRSSARLLPWWHLFFFGSLFQNLVQRLAIVSGKNVEAPTMDSLRGFQCSLAGAIGVLIKICTAEVFLSMLDTS